MITEVGELRTNLCPPSPLPCQIQLTQRLFMLCHRADSDGGADRRFDSSAALTISLNLE